MVHRFEQQDSPAGFAFPKSAATPQNGQKAEKPAKLKLPRSFQPRPGH
jgi:hypothetical protein